MNVTPWLSVVVPAFNAEKYIEACVLSIDPASHPDVEIILVDDGSSDSTPMLCDLFASKYDNVQVIHLSNSGSSAARNAGCSRATGDWVWFVDSDDLVSPFALSTLKPIVERTDSDAVQMQFIRFSDGKGPSWPVPHMSETPIVVSIPDFLAGIYHGRYQHYMWSYLLRASMLRREYDHTTVRSRCENGFPFREDFSLYEDVVSMEALLRELNSVVSCPWGLYGYRQSTTTMTKKSSNKVADSGLRAVLDLGGYEIPPELVLEERNLEISLLFYAYKLIERNGSESQTLRQRFRSEIEKRVHEVGLKSLGVERLFRYCLFKTGLMDLFIDWRYR